MKNVVRLICAIFFLIFTLGCYEVSTGERCGEIIKFSNKGVFFKTWEGEMILGGGSTNAVNQTFCFSIDGSRKRNENVEDLVSKIQEALISGKRTRIKYVQEMKRAPWRSERHYFVQSVIVETSLEKGSLHSRPTLDLFFK